MVGVVPERVLVVASVTGDGEATAVWGRSSAEEWLALGAAPAKSDIRDGVELLLVADHGCPTGSSPATAAADHGARRLHEVENHRQPPKVSLAHPPHLTHSVF